MEGLLLLIRHGREICRARNPLCGVVPREQELPLLPDEPVAPR